jgi:hypothetical protein
MGRKKQEVVLVDKWWETEEGRNGFRLLVRHYYDCVQERVDLDNMMGLKKDLTPKKKIPPRDERLLIPLFNYRDNRVDISAELIKSITAHVEIHPLWQYFLKSVKGCGPTIAAVILSEFDIYKAPAASNLISFAGIAPGKDRKIKGTKCPYNSWLKTKLCGVLAASFLKSKSPYTVHFYNERQRLENSDRMVLEISKKGAKPAEIPWKDAKPAHRMRAAVRKMVRRFLIDLYVAWRTLENLPVRPPYETEYLGKVHHTEKLEKSKGIE